MVRSAVHGTLPLGWKLRKPKWLPVIEPKSFTEINWPHPEVFEYV